MVRTQQGTVAPTATTDAAGSYTIALPPSTPKQWNYALAASAPGKGVGGVNVQSAKPVDVTIRLTGSGSVAGTVAGADGKPLEGAAVTITADSGSRMRGMPPPPPMSPDAASSVQALRDPRFSTLAASTDASGTFRVDGVPAGTYRVAAVWGLDRGEGSGQVTVRAGGTETVSLVVGGAGTIEGRVLETDGTPVTGATVWGSEVGARDGSRRSSSARSDETGAFKLRNVSGERWNLSVQAAGYTQKSVDNVSPGDRNLEVRLVALGWIEGVVLAEGKPWSGSFTVTAMFAGGNPNETVSSTRMVGGMGPMGGMYWAGNSQREESFSTPDGKFVMRALQAGPWRVNVTTPEGWIPTSPAEVTVADGRGAGPVEQRLVRGATVMGTVSEQGTVEPVSGASVSLRIKGQPETGGATNGWSQTDAKGRWSATGLAGGTYVLQAQCPSGFSVEEEIRLVAGDTLQRDLVALRLGSITVHAVDGEGKPVEGAAVTLTSESGTVVQPNWDLIRRQNLADFNKPDVWQKLQQTDVAGVLQRWHVPPGRVRVDVQLPRAGSQGSSLVDVASDRNTDVTVTLSGGSGPGGAPVPGK
jgi:protocatechuate 3,4-dioxygenase beta subunit